jgi:hypothetical protein
MPDKTSLTKLCVPVVRIHCLLHRVENGEMPGRAGRMAKPGARAIPLETLELYEKLAATNPNVERQGDNAPYTSLNDHMFDCAAGS